MEKGTGQEGQCQQRHSGLGIQSRGERGAQMGPQRMLGPAKEDEEQGYGLAACVFGEEDGRIQENATGSIYIKEIPGCSGLDPATAFA